MHGKRAGLSLMDHIYLNLPFVEENIDLTLIKWDHKNRRQGHYIGAQYHLHVCRTEALI